MIVNKDRSLPCSHTNRRPLTDHIQTRRSRAHRQGYKGLVAKQKFNDILRDGLSKISLPTEFALPLDSRIRVKRLIIAKCRVMTSAKLPMWLTFENADPDGEKVIVMFKAGDDLRQDTVVLQMLRTMDAIWQQVTRTLTLTAQDDGRNLAAHAPTAIP